MPGGELITISSVRVNDERWEQHLGDWRGLSLSRSLSARDICELLKTGPPLAISEPSCRDTRRSQSAGRGTFEQLDRRHLNSSAKTQLFSSKPGSTKFPESDVTSQTIN